MKMCLTISLALICVVGCGTAKYDYGTASKEPALEVNTPATLSGLDEQCVSAGETRAVAFNADTTNRADLDLAGDSSSNAKSDQKIIYTATIDLAVDSVPDSLSRRE